MRSRSLAFLDWPEVIARLAGEARSARGASACRDAVLAHTPAVARERLAEVSEMTRVIRAGNEPPGLSFPEIEPWLDAAEKGAPLGPQELQEVATVCEISHSARRFFEARSGATVSGLVDTPRLWLIAQELDPRDEIARRVRQTFDANGEVRDSVSPDLARLRRERETLSVRVREEVESIMKSEEWDAVLQDRFVTLRADRYVVPLKASAKSLGLGIVHDTSRSGETVFVEPTAVVGLNNRLKVAEIEITRETRRILAEIARRVADAAPALRKNLEILTRLDVIAAKARLSVAWNGAEPAIDEAAHLDLRRARHPLLSLRGEFEVVSNDLELGRGEKVLVITGPNAGGKTVLLKTAGLAALLVRLGMHPPCAEGSRVGFFDPVLADIGDQQSIVGDLSTFSAHLANVGAIVEAATASGARALVLVDELMVGTNPEQGAALARAVLEALADAPGLVITTTHYDSLKALAQSDPRFRNAAMEYDLERLRPTFKLRDGVPGRSYAFDIAERMGLPKGVLARARALAKSSSIELEDVISRLEAKEAELAREADALAAARREIESTAGDQRAAAEALAKREKELALHSRRAIEDAVREAREAIRAIVREAQSAGSARAAEAARRAVEETAKVATRSLPEEPPPPGEPITKPAVGMAVWVPSLKSDAVVAKVGPKKVKVSVGALTFEVDVSELRAPREKPKTITRKPEPMPIASEATEYSVPTSQNTVDLRGLRADEAVTQVEQFLDRAALDGRTPIFVLHGHGTGALKTRIRDYLAHSPYVRKWQPGSAHQGGDGVSVVDLR